MVCSLRKITLPSIDVLCTVLQRLLQQEALGRALAAAGSVPTALVQIIAAALALVVVVVAAAAAQTLRDREGAG